MLSLVSYGSSGESEDEDNSSENGTTDSVNTLPSNMANTASNIKKFNDDEWDNQEVKLITNSDSKVNDSVTSNDGTMGNDTQIPKETDCKGDAMLSKLPPPITDMRSIPWDQLSKLTYKSRAVRIMATPIPEEDVEEKKEKKIPSKTGSGLLSMLPRPRNEFLATPSVLRPSSVTKKPTPTPVKSKPVPKPKLKSQSKPDSDSEGETEENVDFFSLVPSEESAVVDSSTLNHLTDEIPLPPHQQYDKTLPAEIPLPLEPSSRDQSNSYFIDTSSDSNPSANSSSVNYVQFQSANDELQLDSEALAALCGSRGLKRRAVNDEEFKIIDIAGSQLTPDVQELLTKNLTADQPRPKRNNKDGPTSQQKRKHQIIYLAHQAKEQELELQNTWSNNRMTKKQTQAKYGF